MNASSSTSYSPYSPFASPYSRHNIDRDVLAQRALLGEDAYLSELESPSPLATPSPMMKQLSPLTVASHLQDLQHNPFLDDYDTAREPGESCQPCQPLSAPAAAPLSVKRDVAHPPRSSLRSASTMTSSPLHDSRTSIHIYYPFLVLTHPKEHPLPARQAPRGLSLDPASATLPTIQETISSSPSRRRRTQPATMNTYPLPPSSYVNTPASPTPTWRRPSPFPLGPVPPPLPPRRVRYEPQPHIVDVAVERFNINTRTISSPVASTPASALDQERQRQWQQWEAERIRSLEMTREAAKNNRVQASSSYAASSDRTTSSVNEAKVSPAKSKGKWWCFGGDALESDHEEVNEKQQYGNPKRRGVSSLEAVDVDEDAEEDEEEWSEARAASGTGYVSSFDQTAQTLILRRPRLLSNFGFSCSKSSSRRRATLKKKAY